MQGNLYVITNTKNNHKYIGKTYNTIETRFEQHLSHGDIPDEDGKHKPLYQEMRKYGKKYFTIERIGIYRDGLLELKEVETIAKYRASGFVVLNTTGGGDGSMMATKQEERDIIELFIVACLSVNDIAGIRDSSTEHIAKVLKANYIFPENISKYRSIIKRNRQVIMLDKDTGKILKRFDSRKAAGEYLNISDPSHISKVCRGKRDNAFGYKWKYA